MILCFTRYHPTNGLGQILSSSTVFLVFFFRSQFLVSLLTIRPLDTLAPWLLLMVIYVSPLAIRVDDYEHAERWLINYSQLEYLGRGNLFGGDFKYFGGDHFNKQINTSHARIWKIIFYCHGLWSFTCTLCLYMAMSQNIIIPYCTC